MTAAAARLADEIRATSLAGIVRFANDPACVAEMDLDDIGQAAVSAFGTFVTYDVETHRSADAADFVLAMSVDEVYALVAALIDARATSPRKVGDFLYHAAKAAA